MAAKLTDSRILSPRVEVKLKEMPQQAYRIARAAATIAGMPVAMWIALAILEKWDTEKNG